MRFDAPNFAAAYLSVLQASAKDKEAPILDRTIAIEEFPTGVRFVATDRHTLLTAWVAGLDARFPREPMLDEAPDRTVIVRDDREGDQLGKQLLRHIVKVAKKDEDIADGPEGTMEVSLDFDVRIPAGTNTPPTFEGMEPTYAVLTVPDVEKVYMGVVEGTFVDWRSVVAGFQPEKTEEIAFNPEFLGRIAGVKAYVEGPLVWQFGGPERVALIDFPESFPHVTGVIMPVRLLVGNEEPRDEDTANVSTFRARVRDVSAPAEDGEAPDDPENYEALIGDDDE
jgi:hypothetical protein